MKNGKSRQVDRLASYFEANTGFDQRQFQNQNAA